ncbi:response regulator [Tenacibaculum sp. M341]|uniref:response regulator n=1 Tax=Tenacibaculum sp. M341 TaxID=2530339 RepID=UPI00104D249E|nr:response regulator [Tenacibaculum sp. M341]TCI91862.1 response regulator transcription factor [Tenacibaculum sp. M341]
MYQKILVVEDQEIINIGLQSELKKLDIETVDHVKYCDDANLKIQKAIKDKVPYDILITDLSFEKDHREQYLTSGLELVAKLREKKINIPVIVYSVEDNSEVVRRLVHTYNVNAYVCKGRDGTRELVRALHNIFNGQEIYLSSKVMNARQNTMDSNIDDYDIQLLQKLSEGFSQKEISHYFKEAKITPSGLSSVEKRLSKLKDIFRANNPVQLIAIAKDAGFI